MSTPAFLLDKINDFCDKIKKKERPNSFSFKNHKYMSQKNYSLLAGVIFLLVALIHLSRIIFAWPALIAGWPVPIWINWIGLFVAGFLSWQGFSLGKK